MKLIKTKQSEQRVKFGDVIKVTQTLNHKSVSYYLVAKGANNRIMLYNLETGNFWSMGGVEVNTATTVDMLGSDAKGVKLSTFIELHDLLDSQTFELAQCAFKELQEDE